MSMPKHLLDTKRRAFIGASVKAVDVDKRIIRAYASTKAWDRYGERFEPNAFAGDGMKNYLKNPVVLFGHDYYSPPVGKTIAHEFDEQGLILTMQFADTPKAKEVFDLYAGGFMTAFSVGFRPLEVAYEERDGSGEMGVVYKRAELLENSAVPVPANPEAVVLKGMGDKTMQVSGGLFRSLMEDAWDQRVRVPRPGDIVTIGDGEPEAVVPLDAAGLKTIQDAIARATAPATAPDLSQSLTYLRDLAKTVAAKGTKVEDKDLRGLMMQTCNVLRQCIYGAGAPMLEDDAAPLSAEVKAAMVAEYEALSEAIVARGNVTDDERGELDKLYNAIMKQISRA